MEIQTPFQTPKGGGAAPAKRSPAQARTRRDRSTQPGPEQPAAPTPPGDLDHALGDRRESHSTMVAEGLWQAFVERSTQTGLSLRLLVTDALVASLENTTVDEHRDRARTTRRREAVARAERDD